MNKISRTLVFQILVGIVLISTGTTAQCREAATPSWLAKLFPHTGQPDRLAHRFRRAEATEFEVLGKPAAAVTVELKFPGLDGNDEFAKARIFLPPLLQDDPTAKVPLLHNAGYEITQDDAAIFLALGYAVSTPHAHSLNPIGRGTNLDRAILHAVRQLPCIDSRRISIYGGSAGGWMTLMLAAETFPLVCAMPDVPPIHLGFNSVYIDRHAAMAAMPAGTSDSPLPVLNVIVPIAEQAKNLYGMPFDGETFLALSPLVHLDTITTPILATFSTADMLVPITQVSTEFAHPYDQASFPKGFSAEMTDNIPSLDGKRRLLEALSPDQYELFHVATAENPIRFGPDFLPLDKAKQVDVPFSKEKPWSIAILEEGPIEPSLGHFKYAWNLDHTAFHRWAETRGVVPNQLTPRKLERLMRRLQGKPWKPFQMLSKGQLVEAQQLDYPEAERADVLLGLTAFAKNDACATQLAKCYEELPNQWKTLGPTLGQGTPESIRKALHKQQSTP